MILYKSRKLADDIDSVFPLSTSVKKAIAFTPRELFVPIGFQNVAYKLDALPLNNKQWISSPLTVAKMTEALLPQEADSVLEIGCGSGYQAAILSQLLRRVFTMERIEPLLIEAKVRFKTLNLHNIHTRFDDGQKGWKSYAPYDRIILSASIKEVPKILFEQLQEGGILVAPIQHRGKQIITRFTKKGSRIHKEEMEECLFVTIQNGTQK